MVTLRFCRTVAALLLILASSAILSASGTPVAPAAPMILSGDLNSNDLSETYRLKDHILTVTEDGRAIWKSPPEYRIDCIALGDIDNDGEKNLVVTLWRKGCFGSSRPFWHTGADESYKNHLFVYKLKNQTFRQVWGSSNLDHPILSFDIRDIDEDGSSELVTTEGEYKKISGEYFAADPDGTKRTTIWKWSGWGFHRI